MFLRALAEVRRELPQVRGLIVGDGEPSEPDYPAYLRKLTRELGLGGAVTFTGHRSDVPQLLGGMRVFVHAAKAPEPFGRVIIESMAARCPVVATAAGGVPEIVQEGVTGCLVPAGDVKATAAAVTRLLTHPESARQMAQRARQSVEQRFTVQHTLEGILRVYDEVLA